MTTDKYVFGGIFTPQGHKNSKEDRCSVVKQVRGSGQRTHRTQAPVIAHGVTQGTHGDVQVIVTRLLAEIHMVLKPECSARANLHLKSSRLLTLAR